MNSPLEQLKKLELELIQPEVRRAGKRFDELLSDDFVEFGMEGKVFSKKHYVENVPTLESEKSEKYEAEDFKAKDIGTDTVLLTYKASIENLKTGKKLWTLRSSLWQKRKGNWQIIFHQGTIQI